MKPFIVTPTGGIETSDGSPCTQEKVDATKILVPHLQSHVETWTLPRGEKVKVLVSYSCHCWTSQYDPDFHGADGQKILDGRRERVWDAERFAASKDLPDMIRNLHRHRVYVTASERNYGAYNTSVMAEDGLAYTAFFVIRQKRGRFNRIRHQLQLFVESAYSTDQPQTGSKTSISAALAAALHGKMVRYRR